MKRRDLLRYLLAAPIAATLDVEKLLWIPGEKTIFIPKNPRITITEIVALELERISYRIRNVFEQDDMFYKAIKEKVYTTAYSGELKLTVKN